MIAILGPAGCGNSPAPNPTIESLAVRVEALEANLLALSNRLAEFDPGANPMRYQVADAKAIVAVESVVEVAKKESQ